MNVKTEELAATCWRVISDRTLRQSLIIQGYTQTARLSWEPTAQDNRATYQIPALG